MNKSRKRKAIMDDGMNSEFVLGAIFDGILEIPVIKKSSEIKIPKGITPFSERNRVECCHEAIAFYEMDINFSGVLRSPADYIEDFSRFSALITPDCSLYRDAPLTVQIANVYRNRAIGHYYQQRGQYVIPQIRWGDERTYTQRVLPEKVAFLGVEKHSIVAVGTYGCISGKENKYHFKAGLEAMLLELEPEVVLVYGSMPQSVFGDYMCQARFIQYPDWITRKKAGGL